MRICNENGTLTVLGGGFAEVPRLASLELVDTCQARTRAYPHAFAVPERKMGGGYNYVMFDQVFRRADKPLEENCPASCKLIQLSPGARCLCSAVCAVLLVVSRNRYK
uniref:Uncharacterized protein n=1 Tax=Mycena chlorophos TaxID=658473 RepID=A0ABQ0M8W5_MYCCL|nr:predicted protein [Mycena chlorophos]